MLQEMTFNVPTAIVFAVCMILFLLVLRIAVKAWRGHDGGCHGDATCRKDAKDR